MPDPDWDIPISLIMAFFSSLFYCVEPARGAQPRMAVVAFDVACNVVCGGWLLCNLLVF